MEGPVGVRAERKVGRGDGVGGGPLGGERGAGGGGGGGLSVHSQSLVVVVLVQSSFCPLILQTVLFCSMQKALFFQSVCFSIAFQKYGQASRFSVHSQK